LLMMAGSIVVGGFITAVIRQSSDRHRLIVELEATRGLLAETERRAGTFAERQRLAGEIHDTLAQSFSSIVMHLEAADQYVSPENQGIHRHIDQARQCARTSLIDVRNLIWALRPEALGQGTLIDALQHLVERWSEENSIPAMIRISGIVVRVRPEIEITCLRILQEALANIRKHARARQVRISFSFLDDDVLTIDIHDDGSGFQAGNLTTPFVRGPQSGFGLFAMRERVEALMGTLTIESMPGEGTTIGVMLPLQKEEKGKDEADSYPDCG
jgi:signal transduction histidine kinase